VRVALTGNIASGKSTVARVWERLGAAIIDADVLAREAVEPGSPGLRAVVDLFGPAVVAPDGTLDRDAVRAIVFDDAVRRRALERVLHPVIARLREAEEARLRERGVPIIVHAIPLLFETGLETMADVIVLVDAPEPLRLARLVRDRNLDPAAARAMIDAQMPASAKRARAHFVIENDAGIAELEARAADVWNEIRARAAG
jgi:dephospho-CoA kinase